MTVTKGVHTSEASGRAGGRKQFTQLDRVLISLAHASEWTVSRVAYEDLVLQAWRDWPEVFSLRNHPEHPDASDVHKALYDLKPLGLVVSLGNKIFRLTDAGVERARGIETVFRGQAAAAEATSSQLGTRLARDEQNFVNHARSSRAYATWKSGEADRLIDYDARIFFQFSTGTPGKERRVRVQFAFDSLEKAAKLGLDDGTDLLSLARHLADRFSQRVGVGTNGGRP